MSTGSQSGQIVYETAMCQIKTEWGYQVFRTGACNRGERNDILGFRAFMNRTASGSIRRRRHQIFLEF